MLCITDLECLTRHSPCSTNVLKYNVLELQPFFVCSIFNCELYWSATVAFSVVKSSSVYFIFFFF